MKKGLCLLLAVLLCALCASALGEDMTGVFEMARPGYEIETQDQWGDTAAAILSGNGERVLMVASKVNGAWKIEIDNPKALDPDGECPKLYLDTDTALYWLTPTFEGSAHFSAFRVNGRWGQVSFTHYGDALNGVAVETLYGYANGALQIERLETDENGNILAIRQQTSLPGRWMQEALLLEHFDLGVLPHGYFDAHNWPGEYALQQAAYDLMPGYTYVDGDADRDGLRFVMARPDGRIVFAGATEDETGLWRVAESAPIPQGWQASLGWENFTSALCLAGGAGEHIPLVFSPHKDGRWGLAYNVNFVGPTLAPNLMKDEDGNWRYGDYPWCDIAIIDWTNVPKSREELLAGFDMSGWATPKNPNPEDRLHLRTQPRKDAASLGKYYNGAPVHVLERLGEWTQVDICGVAGYMMTKFLAFGEEQGTVDRAAQQMFLCDEEEMLYALPREDASFELTQEDPVVIGVVGDAWYHVWYPETNQSGYMKQDALTPGNG